MAFPTPPKPQPAVATELVRATAPPTSATRPKAEQPTPDASLETALLATERTKVSLSTMLELLSTLSGGIEEAQLSGGSLARELSNLERLLRRSYSERQTLEQRVTELELELEEARHDSELEHKYVRDEQDRFIAALIDEYEDEIAELRKAMGADGGVKASATALAEIEDLKAELAKARSEVTGVLEERETLRALVHRAQTQRDEAQKERQRLREALSEIRDSWPGVGASDDDRHTRPTEPPPGMDPRAMRRQESPDAQPARFDPPISAPPTLSLSDLEQGWDTEASPAPPPGFDASGLSGPLARVTEPPAELQGALMTPSQPPHPESPSDSQPERDGTHIPATERISLPGELRDSRGHAREAGNVHETGNARAKMPQTEAATELFPRVQVQDQDRPSAPPEVTTNVRPRSIYPEMYRLDDKPPLKRKPDHSLRPLVGYSMGSGEVEAERLSAPPQRPPRDDGHPQR